MTIGEYAELSALCALDPWGEERADARAAMIAGAAAAAATGKIDPCRYHVGELFRRYQARTADPAADYSDQHAAALTAMNARLRARKRA